MNKKYRYFQNDNGEKWRLDSKGKLECTIATYPNDWNPSAFTSVEALLDATKDDRHPVYEVTDKKEKDMNTSLPITVSDRFAAAQQAVQLLKESTSARIVDLSQEIEKEQKTKKWCDDKIAGCVEEIKTIISKAAEIGVTLDPKTLRGVETLIANCSAVKPVNKPRIRKKVSKAVKEKVEAEKPVFKIGVKYKVPDESSGPEIGRWWTDDGIKFFAKLAPTATTISVRKELVEGWIKSGELIEE